MGARIRAGSWKEFQKLTIGGMIIQYTRECKMVETVNKTACKCLFSVNLRSKYFRPAKLKFLKPGDSAFYL